MFPIKIKKSKEMSYDRGDKQTVNMNLVSMLIKHAHNNPNQIAIQTSDNSWTYQNLYQDVLAWQNRIRPLGIKSPALVCLHRTPRMLSILIALQSLEIPYIPIELKTPIKRIRAIVEDSKAQILLHDTTNHESYMTLPCSVRAICDLENTGCADLDILQKDKKSSSNATSYIIYTSGSTGTPKGVKVSKSALCNFLTSMSKYFMKDSSSDIMLATTTIAFDIAALELYLPIWQQKTIFLANQNEHKDPEQIQRIFQKYPIKISQGTPSFWNMLHYSGWKGKKDLTILCGGEPLTTELSQNLLPEVKSLWNMYGPTEATIWCSLKQIKANADINVGKPIHNMAMWVLDSSLRPLPPGVKGELYISGQGLAEGYINHQRLTEEKFIFYRHGLKNHRLYRTGDVACMTENKEFIIFGRMDNQIKLHGYRIELEDIETHIQANLGVRECVVGVYQEQLIAYICVVPNGCYDEKSLVSQLEQEIPKFMVPKRFIYLDKLPLNTSGKLDRRALSLPNNEIQEKSTNLEPMQNSLMEIWQEALEVNSMNVDDTFFELGGHSLSAARIVAKVHKNHNKKVKIHDIYHAPTISEFAELVTLAPVASDDLTTLEEKEFSNWMPLTDFQFVLWISDLFEPDVKRLNVVDRRRIAGSLSLDVLNLALQNLIQKHDVLSYSFNRFLPIQKRDIQKPIKWLEESLLGWNEEKTESYLHKSIKSLSSEISWPKKKPLIIAKLFHLNNGQSEIQISMPHMIADQQSLEIFFQQLSFAYMLYEEQEKDNLKLETKPFEAYARHEYQFVKSSMRKDEKFWREYLEDTELFRFPNKYIISDNEKKSHSYSSFFHVDDEQINTWKKFCINNSVTLNDLLCAAIGSVLFDGCKNEISIPKQLFINTVKSSREDPCYDEVIGCFLKAAPVKLNLTGEKNLASLAKQVQQSAIETAAHQYASSLVKLSSVGHLKFSKNRIKPLVISLVSRLYCKLSKHPQNLNIPLLNACKRMATLDGNRGFVINVNIWDNFFLNQKKSPYQLFGTRCQPIPMQHQDIFTINGVLDVCLMRDNMHNKSFLVLSANLKPEFREHLGTMLLRTME
jgi:amino acid adenylation domain-containing protein